MRLPLLGNQTNVNTLQTHLVTIISLHVLIKISWVVLDSKLDFSIYVEQKIRKCNKIIELIRRLFVYLPRKAVLTIYKSFVRPHLDYCVFCMINQAI